MKHVWLSAVFLTAIAVAGVAAQTPARYAGRPLADVLRDLQSRGLNIVFSSELVKPEMRVVAEPRAASPRKMLDEVLEPHRLKVTNGSKGTLLVIRAQSKKKGDPSPPGATGAIQGVIVDKRTGDPLPGVTVRLQSADVTTVTNANGRFRLEKVPAEPQPLFVSLVGYGLARPIVSVEAGRTAEITIALADGLGTYSEEVIVAGDRFRAADPGVPTQQTLTSADLQDIRGVLADDPLRAVQALPGVATGDDFRSEFSVRGSDFRHIGLSIDGVPAGWLVHLTRALQDTGSVSIVNGDVIERASLLSGPYPQRMAGRAGAWLTFDLQEGSREHAGGHLSVSGTSSSISVNGPFGRGRRGSWLVSARQSYLQWLIRQIDAAGGTAFGFTDAVGKFVYDVSSRQQVQASLIGGRSVLEEDGVGPGSVRKAVNRTGFATFTWRSVLPRAVLTQRASIISGDFTNTTPFGQLLGDGRLSSKWYLADLRATLGRGVSFIGTGAVMRSTEEQTVRQFAYLPGSGVPSELLAQTLAQRTWLSTGSAGVAWQNRAGSALDAGLSVMHSPDVSYTPLSPWLVAAQPLGRGVSLRGGVSVSWQMPDTEQLALYAGVIPIRPERALSVDAAIEHRVSESIRWQITWFSRTERDVFRLDDAEPRLAGTEIVLPAAVTAWRNALTGSARGVEAMVQRRAVSGLSGWIGYSFGRTRYDDVVKGESFWADFDQRHAFNAYGIYRFTPKTSLSGKVRLGSNFPLPGYFSRRGAALVLSTARNNERLPFYSRFDLRMNHAFTFTRRRLTLFAEVLNVLAHTNYGPTDGSIRTGGELRGFTEKLMPFLPSLGFVFDF